MEEVLHYLELKNQYYEKFYSVTLRFMEQAAKNHWDDIELFVDNRERILNIIHSYDFKISSHFQSLRLTDEELVDYRQQVKRIMEVRGEWAKKIVELDLELISRLEEMKVETIRELKRTMETSQQLNSFTVPPKRTLKPRKDA